ncbi:MAG: SIS domain-containing protein [Aliidongia sp.]
MTAPADLPAMAREAAETSEAVQRQIERCAPLFKLFAAKMQELRPSVVVTCARGSSDHAAAYGKYLIETRLGLPVASIGPSVASLYKAPLQLKNALFIAVSQSGRSPDLLRLTEAAASSGAYVVCMVNDEESPLAKLADLFIPLCAGKEISVAATKSYLTAAFAFLQLVAHWQDDAALKQHVAATPGWLTQATRLDWNPALQILLKSQGLYVIGRGLGTGAAAEMALKFKETCRIHAEAFSAAEVIHGPLELAGAGFPGDRADATRRDGKLERCRDPPAARSQGSGAEHRHDARRHGRAADPTRSAAGSGAARRGAKLLHGGAQPGDGARPQPGPAGPSAQGDGDGLMRRTLTGARIFTGETMLDDAGVLIEDGAILDIGKPPGGVETVRLPEGALLVPGFIDAQVNGGGGVLFNETPDEATIRTIVAAHRRFGTTGLLPTLVTDDAEKMRAAARAAIALTGQRGSGVLGLHLEGPYLSVERRGVHKADFIRKPTPADIDELCGWAGQFPGGKLLVTVAPENVDDAAINRMGRRRYCRLGRAFRREL